MGWAWPAPAPTPPPGITQHRPDLLSGDVAWVFAHSNHTTQLPSQSWSSLCGLSDGIVTLRATVLSLVGTLHSARHSLDWLKASGRRSSTLGAACVRSLKPELLPFCRCPPSTCGSLPPLADFIPWTNQLILCTPAACGVSNAHPFPLIPVIFHLRHGSIALPMRTWTSAHPPRRSRNAARLFCKSFCIPCPTPQTCLILTPALPSRCC